MRRPRREAQGPRPAGRCSSAGSSRSSSASPWAACAGCSPSALCPRTSPSRRYRPWRYELTEESPSAELLGARQFA
ncbi:integrator complex subunit 4-like protein 2 [Symphalangus syndactylus]|uniref:integrator complex subunit 4-like protein 2 n=1 Tax=Symphalangus syndactylus TaxID=9590 RepID=UPI003006D975